MSYFLFWIFGGFFPPLPELQSWRFVEYLLECYFGHYNTCEKSKIFFEQIVELVWLKYISVICQLRSPYSEKLWEINSTAIHFAARETQDYATLQRRATNNQTLTITISKHSIQFIQGSWFIPSYCRIRYHAIVGKKNNSCYWMGLNNVCCENS